MNLNRFRTVLLKTRAKFEVFQPKMGVLRPFLTEIWMIEVLHFFGKKVGKLEIFPCPEPDNNVFLLQSKFTVQKGN